MTTLTPTQARVLEYVVQHINTQQAAPTRAEISERFGWSSPFAAECHIKALERKGLITLRSGKARGIVVLQREAQP